MIRTATKLLAAAALVATVAACGGDGEDAPADGAAAPTGTATDKVEVVDFKFKPENITVKAGTTVTWTFNDSELHTVGSKSGGPQEIKESPELKGGGTFTHTFSTAGTYPYVCTIHNFMTGSVVVTAA